MVGLLIAGINEMTNNLGDAHKAISAQGEIIAKQREDMMKMQAQIDASLEKE